MHPTLEQIKAELVALINQVQASVTSNEPFNVAHANWTFPGLTRDELTDAAASLINLINDRGGDILTVNETALADYPRRLVVLRAQTVPQIWGNPAAAVPAYMLTLDGVGKLLNEALSHPDSESDALNAARELKTLRRRLSAIEATLAGLEPRAASLTDMISRIESAHEAADQLPTDLATLDEVRKRIDALFDSSAKDQASIANALSNAKLNQQDLLRLSKEAEAVIARCDDAYRATTSQGLASAFTERSKTLSLSMWVWVVGLVAALLLGGVFGSNQLRVLAEAINSSETKNNGTMWVNLFLSLLSVGGPIWFAWIATKQIGQRFRLAEDYGYKASISKAYEGYRREAALLDPEFQSRLFASALTRLDEIPLRLVETDTHGSPWHELANSDLLKQAIRLVPGFADSIHQMAKNAIDAVPKVKLVATAPKAKSSEIEAPV